MVIENNERLKEFLSNFNGDESWEEDIPKQCNNQDDQTTDNPAAPFSI